MTTFQNDTSSVTSRSMAQYQHFFPGWGYILLKHLDHECRVPMANYRNSSYPDMAVSYQVLDCLLSQFPEFRKAELSASAVVLGLIPAILQLLSPTPAETAMLGVRRPLLALLISASIASASPLRNGQYVSGAADLERPLPPETSGRVPFTLLGKTWHMKPCIPVIVSAAEYLIAGAAAANTAYRTYQLCIWTVCTFVPTQAFLPAMWHLGAFSIHLLGWAAALLRFRSRPKECRYWMIRWLRMEVVPSAWATKFSIQKRRGGATEYLLYMTDFIMYILVPLQIFYGSIILSSLVFVSVFDAVSLVCWYSLSTITCRAILLYEFAGMRQTIHTDR
ncbi:hypothetical protein CDD81_2225 [Ophiocordyceps australis]|uniref:Uncharacterized protein n=1 Tax=Ophiocordyceps australis TaxID=1399860 RepID=A0A2C5XZE9_9HYPO|nr:hypothetical protein CDD81_2225 [Ophiocordyceps australis]